VNVYIPDATGTAEMISSGDGTFNIIGLDAGTYYVKETEAPAGYNLIKEAKAITITATHSESGGTNAVLDLGENAISYTYVNNAGTSLPGTGGIGTTIFYLGGGAMAAIGGIYLISKRRMKKSEE
jgi:LPXTG-motif cell wall-anchored protein